MLGLLQRSAKNRQTLSSLIGFLLFVSAAVLAVVLFGPYDLRYYVPLLFVFLAIVVAAKWGASGTILGLLAAAAVFAVFLFSPIGSLRVSADTARDNLAWMLLLGLPAAYLFAKPPDPKSPLPRK